MNTAMNIWVLQLAWNSVTILVSTKHAHLTCKEWVKTAEVATFLTCPFRTLAVRQTVQADSFSRFFSVLPCYFLCKASNSLDDESASGILARSL